MKILFTALFILWMAIVFILSNQNAEESSNLSGNFIEKILQVKDEIYSKSNSNNSLENNNLILEVDNIDFITEEDKEIKNSEEKSEKIVSKRIQKWQKLTRKIAHYTIYAVGGIIIYCMIVAYAENRKITIKKILLTTIIGIFYAVLDEIHQFFSDGRSPQIFDVIVDTFGIITGIIIAIIAFLILNRIINYIYERRNEVND